MQKPEFSLGKPIGPSPGGALELKILYEQRQQCEQPAQTGILWSSLPLHKHWLLGQSVFLPSSSSQNMLLGIGVNS